jgi:hypothetical protein
VASVGAFGDRPGELALVERVAPRAQFTELRSGPEAGPCLFASIRTQCRGRPATLYLAPYALSLLLCQPPSIASGSAGTCSPTVIGLDTSCVNNSADVFLGEAIGQTFAAAHTQVRRITVWRVAAEDSNVFGIHIFILRTDSLGAPNVSAILLDGPTVVVPYGDGQHHVRFDFMFDPPFTLPSPGTYCFAVQANPCYGFWDLVVDTNNDYGGGSIWYFSRSDCFLRAFPLNHPAADLIFEVEFCDTTTPTRRSSWGQLKAIYR